MPLCLRYRFLDYGNGALFAHEKRLIAGDGQPLLCFLPKRGGGGQGVGICREQGAGARALLAARGLRSFDHTRLRHRYIGVFVVVTLTVVHHHNLYVLGRNTGPTFWKEKSIILVYYT